MWDGVAQREWSKKWSKMLSVGLFWSQSTFKEQNSTLINVLAGCFSNFDVHIDHLESLLERSQSARTGGWRVYISNQFPGDVDAAGPHHTCSSKTLAYPDRLYIKMLPLDILSQCFLAFLCSQLLGICNMGLIFYCVSAESSKGVRVLCCQFRVYLCISYWGGNFYLVIFLIIISFESSYKKTAYWPEKANWFS